jgi:hypothetical protein
MTLEAGTGYRVTIFYHRIVKASVYICHCPTYSKRQKAEGRGKKVYYWYVFVSGVRSVLTFMATAISKREGHLSPSPPSVLG